MEKGPGQGSHCLDEGITVQRKGQGLTHTRVVEGLALHIGYQVNECGRGPSQHCHTRHLAKGSQHGLVGKKETGVDALSLQSRASLDLALDGKHLNLVEQGCRAEILFKSR